MATPTAGDNGFSSRKLWFSVFSTLAIMFGAIMSAWKPTFRTCFESYCGACIAVLSIYSGSNLGHRYITAKHGIGPTPADDAESSPEASQTDEKKAP